MKCANLMFIQTNYYRLTRPLVREGAPLKLNSMIFFCMTMAGFLMWGTLPDERVDL
jgi:hypothetical protein